MAIKFEPCAVILPALKALSHHAADLEKLFAKRFYTEYKTLLCGGAKEPLYKPALSLVELGVNSSADYINPNHRQNGGTASESHTLFYREDFYASALHEISHWCIAGCDRRKLLDFGYWYTVEGRDKAAQQKFYAVEKKPQAIEYLFSIAAGYPFSVSADNPTQACDNNIFWQQVNLQAAAYCKAGMPLRAKQFCQALLAFYQPDVKFIEWFNGLEALLLEHHNLN